MSLGKTVPVFGVSGVGKTSLIKRIARDNSRFIRISASSIIEALSVPLDTRGIEFKNARNGELFRKQELAALEMLRIAKANPDRCVILDAHNVIEFDGDLVILPVQIFKRVSPLKLLFVYDDPKEIARRRIEDTTRLRPHRSEAELCHYQNVALNTARNYAKVLGINVTQIRSGDLIAFRNAIDSIH